jgi:DNA-binding MarR family transcriptional regulator
MLNQMEQLVERATYSRRGPRGRSTRATPEQLATWRALLRAHNAVGRSAQSALSHEGLDASDYDVLVTLAEGPLEGLRPTELADRVLLTKSGITRLVDRLVERRLIERRACPSDRRGQLVALTATGRGRLRRAAPEVLRRLRVALGSLTAGDLAALRRVLERIEEAASKPPP